METWRISGEEPLPLDERLQYALRFGATNTFDGGGIALNLGIVNLHGRVYRIVRAWDLALYRQVCQTLESLELRRLQNSDRWRVGVSMEDVFAWTPDKQNVQGHPDHEIRTANALPSKLVVG